MRSIKNIQDVVDWNLCVGCGACSYACSKKAVTLSDVESVGIRPTVKMEVCANCKECLDACPGYRIYGSVNGYSFEKTEHSTLIGRTLEVWEGNAAESLIRYSASSGGLLTALSLYCLEKEGAGFVLHTGMDELRPWMNRTVQSRSKSDLLRNCGSRYAPSSPCDSLHLIEESDKPAVFIGKPCDVAAVVRLREKRPKLDAKLGLVMTFFCAGTPSTHGTLELLRRVGVDPSDAKEIRYRGNGWPGQFSVVLKKSKNARLLSYDESWAFLQKYRCFRCHLCPDGLGELADLSCGDAWHRFKNDGNPGTSLVLVRTGKGQEFLRRAEAAGYVSLIPSNNAAVIAAQGLAQRRRELFGRLLAMQMLAVPTPKFQGFPLFGLWLGNPFSTKLRTILGTSRRLLQRGLWHRNRLTIT